MGSRAEASSPSTLSPPSPIHWPVCFSEEDQPLVGAQESLEGRRRWIPGWGTGASGSSAEERSMLQGGAGGVCVRGSAGLLHFQEEGNGNPESAEVFPPPHHVRSCKCGAGSGMLHPAPCRPPCNFSEYALVLGLCKREKSIPLYPSHA